MIHLRVVISAGGSGGHIYPALAILNKINEEEPTSEFLYIGTHNRMEKEIIPSHGIPFETIEIYGIQRKQFWKNGKTLMTFFKAIKRSKKLIRDFNPDIVIGAGGYVTGPVLYAAHKLGYKTVIHEQNSIPGKANLFLSKFVDRILVSFQTSMKEFPDYKTIYTGNPCSESAIKAPTASKMPYGLREDKQLVLFVMGSLGSSKMNDFLMKTMSAVQGKQYEVLFVTGKDYYETVKEQKFPSNVKVVPYIDKMTQLMKKTDLMVTRAGASTLSEIIALQIPSILIPSPYVPNNHQFKNAMDLVRKNAALLMEEKDLKGDILIREVDRVLANKELQEQMKASLKSMSVPNSTGKIYEEIKKLVGE